MIGPRVFVCDDEMLIRLWFGEHLKAEGYQAECFEDGSSLLAAVEKAPPKIVLLDLRLPDISGLDVLARLRGMDRDLPVIMMTAYGEVETAVAAVRAGAAHFLEKPVNLAEVLLLIEQALEASELRGELARHRAGHHWRFADVTLVGRSPAMRQVAERVSRIGSMGSPANILIQGESGTGKDLIARAIHAWGPRSSCPFLDVNCTALPEHLVESELFGHEAGAFTGAQKAKQGLFEVAHRGTIFLDEIGDMPLSAQSKLLHVLETHSFRRIGAVRDIDVDVHVIAATNRDLKQAVQSGSFREDLFYRLNVVPVLVPALRERREDIAPLAWHFIEALGRDMKRPPKALTHEAIEALESFDWPGNARQLRNVLEGIMLFEDADEIDVRHLPAEIRGVEPSPGSGFTLPPGGVDLQELEQDLIQQALERAEGNRSAAARLLGLTRDTLRYRMEKHGLE
jgi:DNA-binding NtrC family response regulator